jgi:monoamine oxidase
VADDFDVIVLGAGAAGLAAACGLAAAGLRCCLLEARERCGGRIHTLRVRGVTLPVELGAEFVHGHAAEVFEILEPMGAAVVELPEEHWLRQGGRLRTAACFWQRLDSDLAALRGRLRRDATVAARLQARKMPAQQRARLRGFVEGFHAGPADRVSAKWAAGGGDEDRRQYRVLDGYDVVVRSLRQRLGEGELRLSTAAREVVWRRGRVAVHAETATGAELTVRSRALVCTLPLGVLQAPPSEGVRFEPALREKEKPLSLLGCGQVSKMVLRFREAFWRDAALGKDRGKELRGDQLHFAHAFGAAVPTWWTQRPVLSPVLNAWAGGPAAAALLAMDRQVRLHKALDVMAATLGLEREECERQLAGCYEHDWQADPWSRCAYGYVMAGGIGAAAKLAAPLDDTLFFAGEATEEEQMGTVAGALASGKRAATEVVQVLGRR